MTPRSLIVRTLPLVMIVVGFAAPGMGLGVAPAGAAEQPLSARAANDVIGVTDVAVNGNHVSGTVVNKSRNELKDVRLLVRQAWQWTKESRPGKVSPGRTLVFTVPQSIPAGGSVKFAFDVPPLPAAKGGKFSTTAEVAGFTELVPQS